MLKTLLLSVCLLSSVYTFPLNHENSDNRARKADNKKNHTYEYPENKALAKQATKDLVHKKNADLQQVKNELHELKGPVSQILNLLEDKNDN